MSLSLLTLGLLSAPSAHAQGGYPGGGGSGGGYPGGGGSGGYPGGGWNVTDYGGDAITSTNDGFPLTGTLFGSASNTYPPDMTAAALNFSVDNRQWLQASSGGPHSYDPNPLGLPWLYGAGPGPISTRVVLSALANNYAGNNDYFGSYNPTDHPYHTSQYYQDPSLCESVIGSAQGTVSGTLWALWHWTGTGAPPDHLNILLSTNVQASKSFSYGHGEQPGVLSATATASDGAPFNETATSDGAVQTVVGHHLMRVPVVNGVAAVSLNGDVSASALNRIPYGDFNSQYTGYYGATNGPVGASSLASVSATANIDSREVAISTDTGTTYYKVLTGGVDANGDGNWAKVPHKDDEMKGDVGIPYGEQHTEQEDGGVGQGPTSHLVISNSNRSVTYTGHILGNWATWMSHYWWNSSLKNYSTDGSLYHLNGVGLPTESEIPVLTNVYVGAVVDSDHNGAIIPNETSANGTTDHILFTFQNGDNKPNYPTGNDGDGAIATANYDLTIHQPLECFPSNKPSDVVFRVASPSPGPDEIPMTFQGLDYSTYKGSGSNGISCLCVLNSPSVFWSVSSDVSSVLSSIPYPKLWGVLDVIFAGANIAINHNTPVQKSFGADFNDTAWNDLQSSGDSYYANGTYSKIYFHMSPRVRVNYRWRYHLADVYDASGFKSESIQHDEEYLGPQDVFGVFTYYGPGL